MQIEIQVDGKECAPYRQEHSKMTHEIVNRAFATTRTGPKCSWSTWPEPESLRSLTACDQCGSSASTEGAGWRAFPMLTLACLLLLLLLLPLLLPLPFLLLACLLWGSPSLRTWSGGGQKGSPSRGSPRRTFSPPQLTRLLPCPACMPFSLKKCPCPALAGGRCCRGGRGTAGWPLRRGPASGTRAQPGQGSCASAPAA